MIIANNPSMYAFIMAKNFNNKTNVRVISVGAGENKPVTINPNSTNALTWAFNLQDLIINTEITTHVFLTRLLSEDYHRFQVISEDLSIDDMDGHSIN